MLSNIDSCFETVKDRIESGLNFIEARTSYTTIYQFASAALLSITLAAVFSSGCLSAMLITLAVSTFMKTDLGKGMSFPAVILASIVASASVALLLLSFEVPVGGWLFAVILSAVASFPLGRYLANKLVPGAHATPASSLASLVPTFQRLTLAGH
jgi:hypothetical protein